MTTALAYACARIAPRRSDVAGILNRANQLRIQAGRSEDSGAGFGLLEFVSLPNIDAGAIPFWSECLLLACVMGPRMLASLLVAVPYALFDEQSKQDRSTIIDALLASYTMQDDAQMTAVEKIRRDS